MVCSDPYSVLGLSRNADSASIRAAYKKQALRYHPDKHMHRLGVEAKEVREIVGGLSAAISDLWDQLRPLGDVALDHRDPLRDVVFRTELCRESMRVVARKDVDRALAFQQAI